MPGFPSFLRLLVCFPLNWLFFLPINIQFFRNPLTLLSKFLQSQYFSVLLLLLLGSQPPMASHLYFCSCSSASLLAPFVAVNPSFYRHPSKIRSPLYSKFCSVFSSCLEKKPQSMPQSTKPEKPAARHHQFCPLTTLPSCAQPTPSFLPVPWTGRQGLTAMPLHWHFSR